MQTTTLTASAAATSSSWTLRVLPTVFAFALLAAMPWLAGGYALETALKIMIFGIFAMSLELLVGQTGLVCFGHAGFFGIGAYAVVLLSGQADGAAVPMVSSLLLAVLAAGAYAAATGALSLRTKGVYFIMITLAFSQMAYFVVHDTDFGGGSDGIYMYLKPEFKFGDQTVLDLDAGHTFYFLVWGLCLTVFLGLSVMLRSRYGRALAGIKANEQRMRAAGYATYGYKLVAFIVSAMLAGLAGYLYAVKDGFVNPELLSWHQSGAVLIMIILGGLGHLRGALIGTAAFILLQDVFQSERLLGAWAQHWQLSLGLSIIVIVAFMPNGLMSLARRGGRA